MSPSRRHLLFLVLLLSGMVSGCKDEGIKVYRVARADEKSAPGKEMPDHSNFGGMPQMGAPLSAGAPSGSQTPRVTGTSPADWEEQSLTSMRQASYLVKGSNGEMADISLVSLAGAAGGALDNVNRWLGQIGRPAITEEQLRQMAQPLDCPLGKGIFVNLEGLPQGGDAAKDGRILAGIITKEGETFFFKMRGNDALVTAQKAAFLQWISTVKPAAPPSPQP
ncbi:MAG: hypothetical protein IAE94_08305 [Chthoniobacterales bacterium]|nr:hypothetical protein [Chthoniobacterales bacterium]